MHFHCSCSADTGYSALQIHLTATQLTWSLIRKQTKTLPLTPAAFQLCCFTALFVLLDQTGSYSTFQARMNVFIAVLEEILSGGTSFIVKALTVTLN